MVYKSEIFFSIINGIFDIRLFFKLCNSYMISNTSNKALFSIKKELSNKYTLCPDYCHLNINTPPPPFQPNNVFNFSLHIHYQDTECTC